jgi:hypothetical protein
MAQNEQEMAVQGIKDKGKRKAAYYKLQRENAEEGGDQATTDKIYSKLGRKSHNVDSARGDKAILGVAPFIPEAAAGLGEMAAARGVRALGSKAASMIPRLGKGEAEEAGTASRSLVPRRSTAPPAKSYQHLGRATPVKKALPSKGRALGSSKGAPSVGSSTTGRALSGRQGAKAVTGGTQKSLSTSDHHDYNGELAAQTKRSKIPGGKKGAVKGSRKKTPSTV